MEMTKNDTQMTKGFAIAAMVFMHLFQRLDYRGLYTPLLYIGAKPLVFYAALLSDFCLPMYCFCSGYAHHIMWKNQGGAYYKNILVRTGKFLLNYWMVVAVFSVVGLLYRPSGTMPGSFTTFLGNIFLYKVTYNGAWWFVLTYLILVVSSPLILKLCEKRNSVAIILLFGVLYVAAYCLKFDVLERFGVEMPSGRSLAGWFLNQFALWGSTVFAYAAGVISSKEKLYSKMYAFAYRHFGVVAVGTAAVAVILLCGVGHALVPSAVVAPATGIVSLYCFNLIRKGAAAEKALLFLGSHSTNIWLTHMFFYNVMFKDLVYVAKYPLLIFLLMMLITIAVSCLINLAYTPAVKLYDRLTLRLTGNPAKEVNV